MGLIEFDKLPINNMVGARLSTFNAIHKGQTIDRGYKRKYILTKSISAILSTLHPLEDARYRKMMKSPIQQTDPLFILGHWRSGTTFVHNIFALDRHFGYNTTYQTVFPNLMHFWQPFFKKTMDWLMPDKRPTDNLELQVDLPQEEEFSLVNIMPYSFYNFWFLPRNMMEYAHRYLTFEQATPEEIQTFKETLARVINTSLWNTNGSQFLSKNPPHTARIPQLLEMFPNAKFIYLVRNPYTVFESTKSFFTNTIRPLKLQDISPEEMERNILDIYKILFDKYEKDKLLIPEGNLIEIKFEDFEVNPLDLTQQAYRSLSIDGFEEASPAIEAYLNKKKGYQKNKYQYADRTRALVEENWSFALEKWGYSY